ncbi:hypothetical protein NDN64_07360 [Stenotrophomonas maltophilia]|nr:hypothetical protein [Stenotrophomonas maltophilia]
MIKDIPSREDFENVGSALLNQAWQDLVGLQHAFEEASDWSDELDLAEYWRSATTKLSTTLSLAHQAAEFFLKGRIVEVSPFLLVANSPKDWPKEDADGHTSFSKFRTVDAQDLPRLHDRVAAEKMDDGFLVLLENLRGSRNAIMHTVAKDLEVKVAELVRWILEIHRNLIGGSWVEFRRDAMYGAGTTHLYSCDWIDPQLVREYLSVKEMLTLAEVEQYFRIPAKPRHYLCPHCTWRIMRDEDVEVRSAVLDPNEPSSVKVHCAICNLGHPVERVDCSNEECPGNVLCTEWGYCLTCGEEIDVT